MSTTNRPALRPVHLGRTPRGIEWVCYPQPSHTAATFAADVAEMRRAFVAICEKQGWS